MKRNDVTAVEQETKKKSDIITLREYDDVDALILPIFDETNEIIMVKGYGVIRGTKDRADGCKDHQRKVYFGDVKTARQRVIAGIVADCQKERGGLSGEEQQTLYTSLKKINERSHEKIIEMEKRTFGWSTRTAQATLSYLVNSIATAMETEDTMEGVASELVRRALENKNSGDDEAATRRNLQKTIDRAERLLRRLQQEYEELRCYEVTLPIIETDQAAITEQEKALTAVERTLFGYALWALAERKVPEAFGAVMMYHGGMRTAESAAPLLGEIEISEEADYATYFVDSQIQNGKAVDVLKTDNAYRQIVLPGEAVRFVQLRIKQLRADGFSEEQIKLMPLASYDNAEGSFVPASALSGFVKDLLLLCGVQRERLATDGAEKLVIDREDKRDITAYILRRDFATRGIYCCGITPAEMDYLLGHISDEVGYDVVRANRGTPTWAKSIADRLGCYVTVPELSIDPTVVPITTSPEERIALEGRVSLRITPAEDCVVKVVVKNAEAADYLHLETDGEYDPKTLVRTTEPEDVIGRKDRNISMATRLPAQQYAQLRHTAEKIVIDIVEGNAAKSGKTDKEA